MEDISKKKNLEGNCGRNEVLIFQKNIGGAWAPKVKSGSVTGRSGGRGRRRRDKRERDERERIKSIRNGLILIYVLFI